MLKRNDLWDTQCHICAREGVAKVDRRQVERTAAEDLGESVSRRCRATVLGYLFTPECRNGRCIIQQALVFIKPIANSRPRAHTMRNTREHVSTRRSRKQVRDRLEFSLSRSLSLSLAWFSSLRASGLCVFRCLWIRLPSWFAMAFRIARLTCHKSVTLRCFIANKEPEISFSLSGQVRSMETVSLC